MDVRCEKCLTEYELDESKVTAAGVTVKCTNCGNLFKIKRRTGATPPPQPPVEITPPPEDDKMWTVRGPDGETKRFRELTTLQQWIVEQKVTRDHEISRSGESWKRLGDIAELGTFFHVVEQAKTAAIATAKTEVQPALQLPLTPPVPPAPTPPEPEPPEIEQTPGWEPPRRAVAGPSEPAWTVAPTAMGNPAVAPSAKVGLFDDEYYDELPRRSRGPWLLIGVLVLAAGAVGGIWFAMTSGKKPEVAEAPQPAPLPQPAAAATPDAPPAPKTIPGLTEGLAKLAEDNDAAFAEAEKKLDAAHLPDPADDAKVWAALSLVNSVWAQALTDDADAAKDKAAELRAESDRRLTRAEKFAKEAFDRAATSPETQLAQAEVLRQKKILTAEVEKALAGAGDSAEAIYSRAMLRIRDGKLDEGQKLLEQALSAREQEGGVFLRARYRLALLAAAQKKDLDAKTQLDALLQAAPEHARGLALKKRLAEGTAVAANPAPEPPKPEAKAEAKNETKPDPKPQARVDRRPEPEPRPKEEEPRAADYDGLVARGNLLAENGDCRQATTFFERALDVRPGGVEALSGIGYCYIDRKDYGKALLNFRAALGISPRYGDALVGMAEAFRFQGKKDEAAEYYRRYLERNPNGPKAGAARKFLQEFGGAPKAEPPPATEPAPQTSPPPPEAPKPTPQPEPERQAPPPPPDRLPDKPGTSPEAPPSGGN